MFSILTERVCGLKSAHAWNACWVLPCLHFVKSELYSFNPLDPKICSNRQSDKCTETESLLIRCCLQKDIYWKIRGICKEFYVNFSTHWTGRNWNSYFPADLSRISWDHNIDRAEEAEAAELSLVESLPSLQPRPMAGQHSQAVLYVLS